MKENPSHIRKIKVVSNTHWDREWRESFELTRYMLVKMMDHTLKLLEEDPAYHSFTLDGQCIPIEDYLEIRPEKRAQVEKLLKEGRLIIGPYYTLAEQFSISQEPLVRNLMFGQKMMKKYQSKTVTTAYTPCSWGQTGQYPQILADFGLKRVMFYRGISHDEAPKAEYIWSAPDGTRLLASRFAVFARYNWYYFVHRKATRSEDFLDRRYTWGKFDEVPFRITDHLSGKNQGFHIQSPSTEYDRQALARGVEEMIGREGSHYSTEIFLAMNGHDLSCPFPHETKIIRECNEMFDGKYEFEHTSLEEYWDEVEKELDQNALPVLTGERRSFLKEGLWTTLMPDTISARINLKQKDFSSSTNLVYYAEPMACIALASGADYPSQYLENAWQYLLSNHTHDSNGGCAPDSVCADMEYRYRKVSDISNIVSMDSMAYIAKNLSGEGIPKDAIQLIVYNTLPFERDAIASIDLDVPENRNANFVSISDGNGIKSACQLIESEITKEFVDNMLDSPGSLDVTKMKIHAELKGIPALGYRTYTVTPEKNRPRSRDTLITGPNGMENEYLKVMVNSNGTVDITDKTTGRHYQSLNYMTDEGECGNAWVHESPREDLKVSSLGVNAGIMISESGPLVSSIRAEFDFPVPAEEVGKISRSRTWTDLRVVFEYTLEKGSHLLKVKASVDNTAKDHLLRINLPTRIETDETWTDSHFDVLSHPIHVPDSTGWVEEAKGTHPLRTFVDMSDGKTGLALITRGIFEYEAYEDENRTLALTIIRACRVIQPVGSLSNILPDDGIQLPGLQEFEYAICVHQGNWKDAQIQKKAIEYTAPVRSAMSGRGKGSLALECSILSQSNPLLQVSCVKKAEDGSGLIVRLYNPLNEVQTAAFQSGSGFRAAKLCKMDETEYIDIPVKGSMVSYPVGPRKIMTFKFILS